MTKTEETKCNHEKSRVINTRYNGNVTRRQRKCLACKQKLHTVELDINSSLETLKGLFPSLGSSVIIDQIFIDDVVDRFREVFGGIR